jgi:hypothetical protein
VLLFLLNEFLKLLSELWNVFCLDFSCGGTITDLGSYPCLCKFSHNIGQKLGFSSSPVYWQRLKEKQGAAAKFQETPLPAPKPPSFKAFVPY